MRGPRGIITAVSPEGVIGLNGQIPWHRPADMKRFMRLTMGGTVIMGRLTWESMNRRALPKRRNIVITSQKVEGVECFETIEAALAACEGPVWFIGGSRIYEEAMAWADFLDITRVPDHVSDPNAVRFPAINEKLWELESSESNPEDPTLRHERYRRRQPPREPGR